MAFRLQTPRTGVTRGLLRPAGEIDVSQLDDETRGDLEALGDLSVSITEWQRRRREQAERRRAALDASRRELERERVAE